MKLLRLPVLLLAPLLTLLFGLLFAPALHAQDLQPVPALPAPHWPARSMASWSIPPT